MAMRVTSAHFVGRAGELAECEAALADARAGSPSVIAISGESGVGKTRLIEAFEAAAWGQARFLRGECMELGEGELPYGALIGALREMARSQEPVLEKLGAGARASLAALLPGLGAAPPARVANDGAGDRESAQLRLFEALLELLELLGEELPAVLLIEDLHWADRSTRAFVAFLARNLRHERVLFVFSYRDEELHRRHPLRVLLSELERGGRTRRLALGPWGREELDEALADILGAPPRADLAERLYSRAEGNPLYTEELLAAGLDGRGAAPQSLRDAFILRIERLDQPARTALRVLAVAGRADERLLAEIAGLSTDALTEALREAVSRHLIAADTDGRFSFRHALLREVAYEDLLPGERSALHLAIARALDARPRESCEQTAQLSAQIASHARASGERALALRAAVEAADAASAIHAHGEAAALLERALELWERVEDALEQAGMDHIELLIRAAQEAHHEQRGRAEALYEAALEELDEQADPVRAARVLEALARTQWGLARGDRSLDSSRRALALLPVGLADSERASVLAWIARTTSLRGRYREAIAAAREALEEARRSGAGPRLESQLLNTLGMALAGCGERDAGAAELRDGLELSQRSGDEIGAAFSYGNLSDVLLLGGRTRESLQTAQEGLAKIPKNLRAERLWLSTSVAEAATALGDLDLAACSLDIEERKPEGRWLINLRLRGAELALAIGRLEEAEQALEEVEGLVARTLEPQFHAAFGLAKARLHRRRGETALAREAVREALDRIELCTDDAGRVTAVAAMGVSVEADVAQRACDAGEDKDLERARACARAHIELVRAAAPEAGPVEAVWALAAEAELCRALGANDASEWAAAVAGWDRLERRYEATTCALRQAEALIERGGREEGERVLADARRSAVEVGSRWLVEEIDGLAARARLDVGAILGRASAGEALMDGAGVDGVRPAGEPFGLTPRELEVLRLLAQGSTNREIGTQLFMAEKTASVHVSRILAKLDVRSRTQAAAVAHRAGLVA